MNTIQLGAIDVGVFVACLVFIMVLLFIPSAMIGAEAAVGQPCQWDCEFSSLDSLETLSGRVRRQNIWDTLGRELG